MEKQKAKDGQMNTWTFVGVVIIVIFVVTVLLIVNVFSCPYSAFAVHRGVVTVGRVVVAIDGKNLGN